MGIRTKETLGLPINAGFTLAQAAGSLVRRASFGALLNQPHIETRLRYEREASELTVFIEGFAAATNELARLRAHEDGIWHDDPEVQGRLTRDHAEKIRRHEAMVPWCLGHIATWTAIGLIGEVEEGKSSSLAQDRELLDSGLRLLDGHDLTTFDLKPRHLEVLEANLGFTPEPNPFGNGLRI